MNRNILFISICLLVFFGIVMRLLPHAPNMTPITALAFVGGLYLGKRWAVLLPCLALFLSDIFIGLYEWKIMLSVYGSFLLIGLLSAVVTRYRSFMPVGFSVIGASLFFFFITNGAVWAFSPWYEKSISGLLYAYELGLPFLRNMLIGDILYTAILIFAFESAFAARKLLNVSVKTA